MCDTKQLRIDEKSVKEVIGSRVSIDFGQNVNQREIPRKIVIALNKRVRSSCRSHDLQWQ